MPHTVEVPDVGTIEFPDSMGEDEIKGVLQKKFPPKSSAPELPQFDPTGLLPGETPPVKQPTLEASLPLWSLGREQDVLPFQEALLKKGRELLTPILGSTPNQQAAQGQFAVPGILPSANPFSQEPVQNEPLVKILRPQPGAEEKILESGTPEEKRLLGYQQGIQETINSLTTPNNIELMALTVGASAVPQLAKLIGLAFSAYMGKQVAKDIPEELGKEYALPSDERDQNKIGQLISKGVAQAGLSAAVGAKSGALELPKPAEVADTILKQETTKPLTEKETNAIHGQTEEVFQPLPQQSGEGAREVPVTERLSEAGQGGEPVGGVAAQGPKTGQIPLEPAAVVPELPLEAPKPAEGVPVAPAEQAAPEGQPLARAHITPDPEPYRVLGITPPGAAMGPSLDVSMLDPIKSLPEAVRDTWRSFSMQSAPKITAADRVTGESGVRYAVAPRVGRGKGELFARRVMEGIKDPVFDRKFGTALTEDNLRSIKDAFGKAGDTASASKVATVIGAENSPFKTETQYQDFLKQPETVQAIERHKQLWQDEKDPMFRQAMDLDPDLPLESRGLQTGARINLKNVMPGEGTTTTVGPASRSTLIKQTATLMKKDPFGRQAKGTGQSYESSYQELMANGYGREYPVAAQHDFIRSLIESGNGVLTEREFQPDLKIKGEAPKAYLMKLRPWAGKFLQIPKSLASEYQAISGLDPASRVFYTKAGEFLTKQSIAGLAEFSTHGANILTDLFLGVGPTGSPLINSLLKLGLRSDLIPKIPAMIVEALGDKRAEMLKLAEINAAKNPYTGKTGWVLNKIDQAARLNAAAIYKRFAKAGILPDTETGLREFVNQSGNYEKKLQPKIVRVLRETQTQPFMTAHQTFLVRGLREIALSPGVKATTNAAALALRMEKAAGVIGTIAVVSAINYLISEKVTGPPGTELGSVGWIGDDGKLHQYSVTKLMGMDRGLRQLGIKGAIEAKRLGLPAGSQLNAGVQGAAQTAVQTVAGPLVQFGTKAATGYRLGVPPVRESKIAVPQGEDVNLLKTQVAENLKTAMQQINPLVDAAAMHLQGKAKDEILKKQISRFYPSTGQSPETIAALPKIVHGGELKAYAEGLAKEARKLPLNQRQVFILKRMDDDGALSTDRKRILQLIKQHGVLKYP